MGRQLAVFTMGVTLDMILRKIPVGNIKKVIWAGWFT